VEEEKNDQCKCKKVMYVSHIMPLIGVIQDRHHCIMSNTQSRISPKNHKSYIVCKLHVINL
jgi:hypothetical protein